MRNSLKIILIIVILVAAIGVGAYLNSLQVPIPPPDNNLTQPHMSPY